MTEEALMKRRLLEDPDYVASKRYGDSLEVVCEHYPEGAPDRVISSVLLITEDEVRAQHDAIVAILRRSMGA